MNSRTLPLLSVLVLLLTLFLLFAINVQMATAQNQESKKPVERIPLPLYVLELDEYRITKDMKMEFCISKNACIDDRVEIIIDAKADELNKPLLAKLLINQKETSEFEIDLSNAFRHEIHFYQLELDETNEHKEILITSYSGGAHCCAIYQVLAEYDGKLSYIHLAAMDGDPHYNKYKFYKGNIRFIDNRFLYAFDTYLNSPAILRYYKIEQGKKVDISDELQFEAYYQETMMSYMEDCESVKYLAHCAAYAAAAAQIGKFDEAWEYITTHYKKDPKRSEKYPHFCKIKTANDAACAEDQVIRFDNFPDALLYTLKEWEYIK